MLFQSFLSFFRASPVKSQKRARERYMLPDEWHRIRAILDQSTPKVRVYFYILLLEGPRMSEARYMEWSHVDLHGGIWVKPVTKTGRAHTIAMSQWACQLIDELPRRGRFVFPGEQPDLPWSRTAVLWHWRKIRRVAGCEDLRIHDLRRTCASWMAQHGENLFTIQKVLNHSSLSVTQVYARLDHGSVKKALNRHAERVMG